MWISIVIVCPLRWRPQLAADLSRQDRAPGRATWAVPLQPTSSTEVMAKPAHAGHSREEPQPLPSQDLAPRLLHDEEANCYHWSHYMFASTCHHSQASSPFRFNFNLCSEKWHHIKVTHKHPLYPLSTHTPLPSMNMRFYASFCRLSTQAQKPQSFCFCFYRNGTMGDDPSLSCFFTFLGTSPG